MICLFVAIIRAPSSRAAARKVMAGYKREKKTFLDFVLLLCIVKGQVLFVRRLRTLSALHHLFSLFFSWLLYYSAPAASSCPPSLPTLAQDSVCLSFCIQLTGVFHGEWVGSIISGLPFMAFAFLIDTTAVAVAVAVATRRPTLLLNVVYRFGRVFIDSSISAATLN